MGANETANGMEGYHQFKGGVGSFEVFWKKDGWYWWACFPGCMPDGESCGPFRNSREAYMDARDSGG